MATVTDGRNGLMATVTDGRVMPDIYGYGQLFAFSGLDGQTSFRDDFVGTLTAKPIGIRFELSKPVTLFFDTQIKKCNAVTSSLIDIETETGRLSVVFSSRHTVTGLSPVEPKLITGYKTATKGNETVCYCGLAKLVLRCTKTDDGYAFILAYGRTLKAAYNGILSVSEYSLSGLIAGHSEFYNKHGIGSDVYARLYLKCLSVLKANIYSPEGRIPCRFTTPDRVPHKKMWLWDSAFHALAIKEFDSALAEEAVEAVLYRRKRSGMIPHMMSPYKRSRITQPPILAYAVWEIYRKTGNRAFLERNAAKLAGYLLWDLKYRDSNGNGLPEWKTERKKNCRCGESGMDNSPRFDNRDTMDAIDFSCFFASDCEALSKIFAELGDRENALLWQKKADQTAQKINELLWDEGDDIYYDLHLNGKHGKIATCASFLPLFCGIADDNRAKKLVENLTDPAKFASPVPIPSLSMADSNFSSDLWRGGVWINYNYMIIHGLKRYGYNELAEEIRAKTLSTVNKWYEEGGCLYEFYDPFDKERPDKLIRKGVKQPEPDWRKHMHAICDFGWTAALTLLLILNK
jgi:hypothetical protein